MHRMQYCRGLYFFQMSQNRVCIRSVFKKKIGPYKVCIFVNMGPYEKSAALTISSQFNFLGGKLRMNFLYENIGFLNAHGQAERNLAPNNKNKRMAIIDRSWGDGGVA